MRISVAGLALAVVILQADISWSQDTNGSSTQDCHANPEADACEDVAKSSATAKHDTRPTASPQSSRTSTMPSVASEPEDSREGTRLSHDSNLRPQPARPSQPAVPSPPTE